MDELDTIFPDLQGLLSADWGTSPGSPLAVDPEHGGVSAEALDAYLRDNAGRPLLRGLETSGGGVIEPRAPSPAPAAETVPGEGDDEELEEEGGDGPPAPEPPPSAPQPEPPAPPTTPDVPEVGDAIRVGDNVFTRDQLEAFARWRHDTQNDPALQQLLTAYYSGQIAPPLAQPPVAAPPSLAPAPAPAYVPQAEAPALGITEDDDPRLVALARTIQEQQRQLNLLSAGVQGVAQQEQARSEADLQSLVNRAANSFQEERSLSDEEIKRLRLSAARMGSMNSLMQGIDPVTQEFKRPDILEATQRSLEIAYYADPQLRQRMIDDAIEQSRERNRKRQRLAAVGGSGGSVSRITTEAPRPGTQAAKEAMTGEVAAMLAGTWTEPGR